MTRLYFTDEKVSFFPTLVHQDCVYFSRDWCAWWMKRFNTTEDECVTSVIKVAAYHGYVDVLESDMPEEKKLRLMNVRTVCFAALGGRLEVLKWLRSEGCPWDESACAGAAQGGHLETLQWLRSEGCPWDKNACSFAAEGGHVEVLKFLRSEGCPWDGRTWKYAAESTREWLEENGCPQDVDDEDYWID